MTRDEAAVIIKEEISKIPLIRKISDFASKNSVEVYIIGGFVRDKILKREKDEIDFLVVGEGVEFVKDLAKMLKVQNVSVFRNFGTSHFRYEGYNLEFVGSRKESYSGNSRNPEVSQGTFSDDIQRRDFTINTLAVSLNKINYGEIIDTFNGLEDIKAGLIKTPLDPIKTFEDDPLRIMRAFRFAAQLNFKLSESSLKAVEEMRERLSIISQERITDEFMKILASPKPSIALILMYQTRVLEIVFPEIYNLGGVDQRRDHLHKDVFYHTCKVVDNIALVTENVWLRFAALVHDIAKPQTKKYDQETGWTFHGHEELGARMMNGLLRRMKLPLQKLEYIKKLVRLHLRPIALAKEEVTDSAIRRLIVEADEDLNDLIVLCRADITSKNIEKVSTYLGNYDRVMQRVFDVKEKDKLRAFQSPVRGETIMEVCGLSPSKTVGLIKSDIEEAILDGRIGNNYEEAFNYMLKIKDNYVRGGE
ncbi:MAG: CCA tRNA nucleotidyltransferase [Ignavibacteriaceae bacterium]